MRTAKGTVGLLAWSLAFWSGIASWAEQTLEPVASQKKSVAQARGPVALELVAEGHLLLVANAKSGTISRLDVQRGVVLDETRVSRRLDDLKVLNDGETVLAIDADSDRFLVLKQMEDGFTVQGSLSLPGGPTTISVHENEDRCTVAALWSHQVYELDLRSHSQPKLAQAVRLPFPPRAQRHLSARRLLVAAGFGGQLAVVDLNRGAVERKLEIPGHNIRCLTLSPDGEVIRIPHQILYADGYTTREGVHWGGVIGNVIRRIPVQRLLQSKTTLERDLYYLGTPDRATGDPSHLLETESGRQIVSYAGLAEIAISDAGANYFEAIAVGHRPTAMTLNATQTTLYVVNSLSDSVSVIDVQERKVTRTIDLGPRPVLSLAAAGERLFYDARLSSDGWFSCHSCHTDGHSNGLLSDTLGDGSFGAPKRVLSLLGVSETGPWAWDGSVPELEQQVHKSLEFTMRGGPADRKQVEQLTAYLRTLRAPRPLRTANADPELTVPIARGESLFRQRGCADCHQPPTYSGVEAVDVGFKDEHGVTEFNPPSLRGVSQRQHFLHDNRARSLRELLGRFQHGVSEQVSGQDLEDLLLYLETL